MTQTEAVFQACEELNVLTSVQTLRNRAEAIYKGSIHYNAVVSGRSKYKKAAKIKSDCRMNGKRGQWRRDMQNDHTASLKQVKRLSHYLKLKRPTVTSLMVLMGEGSDMFHSVEQFKNAAVDLIDLQKAA